MLRAIVIEPAQSPCTSRVVLALIADGIWRFGVDYRRFHAMKVKDTYPITRIDEHVDSLGDAS